MDSGNSGGSMQSSSGGDEESSISPFLNPSPNFGGSISNPNPNPNPNPPPLSHPPTLFDPSSHNLDPFSHPNSSPLYNLDLAWTRNLRSDPNYTDFGNLTTTQSLLPPQRLSQGPFPSLPAADRNAARPPPQPDQPNEVKNSKKRTRASRRAPTTVLTTDTANFRQMVQEFTGIPAAPFSAAAPYSRRLDLFGTGRTGHLDTMGPLYAFRPTVQKVQSYNSFLNSRMDAAIASTSNIGSATNNNNNNSNASISCSIIDQSYNLLNAQNPNQTFQSLLQSSLPLNNAAILGSKSQENSRILSFEELGMRQEHGNTSTRWRDEGASNDGGKDFEHEKGTVDSWICPSD